ncbi:MAG: hypothetical protein ACXVI9_09800, partial [Mucilaginibacter sp.]
MVSVHSKNRTSRILLSIISVLGVVQLGYAQKVNPDNPPVLAVPDTVKTNLVIPQNPADTGKNANG